MKKTLILFLSMTLISCSTLKVSFEKSSINNEKKIAKEEGFSIRKEFFLWGLIPKNHELNVSEVLVDNGFDGVQKFSVYRESKLEDVIWSILSLGVYTPITYRLNVQVE